jgi:hypothetical protein
MLISMNMKNVQCQIKRSRMKVKENKNEIITEIEIFGPFFIKFHNFFLCLCDDDLEAFNNIRKVFNFESALDFTNIPNITTQCREDFKHYHDALKLNELWALKSKSSFTS